MTRLSTRYLTLGAAVAALAAAAADPQPLRPEESSPPGATRCSQERAMSEPAPETPEPPMG